MPPLKWSISHAVWFDQIDDEHREIFQHLSGFQEVLVNVAVTASVHSAMERLCSCIKEHFAHEERLMRAARYGSLRWHRQQHNGARKRVKEFVSGVNGGDGQAGFALIEYLSSWLHDHTRLADRMMCAFLRNERRGVGKLTFTVGTKPAAACSWVDARGDKFDPFRTPTDL
jgi:hemerythrin